MNTLYACGCEVDEHGDSVEKCYAHQEAKERIDPACAACEVLDASGSTYGRIHTCHKDDDDWSDEHDCGEDTCVCGEYD